MVKNSHHVVPNPDGGWYVIKNGTIRASKRFATKQDALNWGREVSRNQHTELFIHKMDGTIQTIDAYGYNPNPATDKKTS